jgi:hypothetical protein
MYVDTDVVLALLTFFRKQKAAVHSMGTGHVAILGADSAWPVGKFSTRSAAPMTK